MNDGHLLVAYHGCDVTVRDDLVAGRIQPRSSKNKYDWLGPGFYLFENDPLRARVFAEAASRQPQRRLTAQPIVTPAVVGCVLSVQRCLDMTTRLGLAEFEQGLGKLTEGFDSGEFDRMPVNAPANDDDADVLLRRLDNAVFALIHELRDEAAGEIDYQAVRGAFRQGAAIAENSGFHKESHVQIAVRDPRCIRGFFLPRGEQMLADDALDAARRQLAAARSAHAKPRRRA